MYRWKRFDLGHIPRASRPAALDLQLRQWSPFSDSGFYVVWQDGLATAFCWDASAVAQAIAAQGLAPGRVRVIPETALRPRYAEGVRMLACLAGVEGQYWVEGQLRHSRWWRQAPSPEAWLSFQRDAGLLPEAQGPAVPTPQALDWLEKPWAGQAGFSGWLTESWRDERWVYLALALLLAPATSWYAAQLYQYRAIGERLQEEQAALQGDAGPLAEARGQALQSLARIQQLRALDPYPHQLELLAWVSEKLMGKGDQLTEWNYRDGKLKLTLATAADVQSSTLVNLLHTSGWFDNIRSTPGKNAKSITFEMDVLELKAVPPADRA